MSEILIEPITNEVSEKQKQVRTLKNWLGGEHEQKRNCSLRSHELGGHMDLKENTESRTICPSNEYVSDLLTECGKKLGIDYVIR